MSNRGNVEEEIGGASEGRVNHHCVLDGGVGEDVVGSEVEFAQPKNGAGGAKRGVEPDGLAGRGERRVWQGKAESFGDNLRGRSGAEELAAPAGRCAGAAAKFGGLFEGDLVLCVACADGLDLARRLRRFQEAA